MKLINMSEIQLTSIRMCASFSKEVFNAYATCQDTSLSYIFLLKISTPEAYPEALSLNRPFSDLRLDCPESRQSLNSLLQDEEDKSSYNYAECTDLVGRKMLLVSKHSKTYLSVLIGPQYEFGLFLISDILINSFDYVYSHCKLPYVQTMLYLQQSFLSYKNTVSDKIGCILCGASPKTVTFLSLIHI